MKQYSVFTDTNELKKEDFKGNRGVDPFNI